MDLSALDVDVYKVIELFSKRDSKSIFSKWEDYLASMLLQIGEELSKTLVEEKKIPVLELFGPTIEGEGQVIGRQTYFIRVAGCDYKCKMCDSMHAVLPEQFGPHVRTLTPTILAEVLIRYSKAIRNIYTSNITSVVLTGGNPLLYDFSSFFRVLVKESTNLFGDTWKTMVETQGTFHKQWLSSAQHVTISPKGPGFGEKYEPEKLVDFVLYMNERPWVTHNIKIVVFDVRDLDFVNHVMHDLKDIYRGKYYLSIGNHKTPYILEQSNAMISNHNLVDDYLSQYRVMLEEIYRHPGLQDCIVLPQMHLLLYGNAAKY